MKKILRSPITLVVLFVVAAGMILAGTIGGVLAAPLILVDKNYFASMETSDIGVGLREGTAFCEDGVLFKDILKEGDFKIGKTYEELLSVENTGDIRSYVRVTVYKYWTDENGKAVDLDPSLIDLHFVTGSGWTVDEEASTSERTVLYYASVLAPGEGTSPFADTLTINGKVVKLANEAGDLDYDQVTFHVQAVADAVQDHNGDAAMTSAWGRTNHAG